MAKEMSGLDMGAVIFVKGTTEMKEKFHLWEKKKKLSIDRNSTLQGVLHGRRCKYMCTISN